MSSANNKYSGIADEALMDLVVKGESEAYAEIYDRYSAKMLNYFYRMLWQNKEKASDFMQELFTNIIEKPEKFDSNRSFKTWLYSCANNMCKNEYKKQEKRQTESISEVQQTPAIFTHPDYLIHDRKNFSKQLLLELNKLEDIHKNTFLLRFFDDCSLSEISRITETAEGTVKSRIFYTLKKLAKQLHIFNPNITEVYHEH